MKKTFVLFVAMLILAGLPGLAQIITTTPELLQESSKNVVLRFHADSPLGNGGMKNLPASTAVYAHIGVITNKSKNTSDWKYTLTQWPAADGSNSQTVNTPKNRFNYVSANTYDLTIGDLRTYFGITDPTEKIEKIALVVRGANGSPEGKTASGGDIFVDVLEDGFAMALTTDAASTVINAPTTMNFTVNTTASAAITLSVNGTEIASATGVVLKKSYTFSTNGSYEVTAKAVYDGKTYTKTLSVAYPTQSVAGTYPGGVPKMGAVKNADGTVTFCLAAPNKTSVVLVPSWDSYKVLEKNTMKYQDYQGARYFWVTVSGLSDNQWYPYYYLVDGKDAVADPYAHLVLDCYSDKWLDSTIWPDMPQYPYELFDGIMLAVYRGDMSNYKFSNFVIPEHSNLVVYEMLFRDFTGTDGEANGNGTVRQAIQKIPYLKELGVNAVELMPIMEFNGNNSWGYNTNFYMAPDKAYGSPKDYKDFIETCHQNGIAVILDIVFNQSDGLHPWYQMYGGVANNPFYNATAPHSYSVLNDWNQDNALVQQQWTDVLKYWMTEYNVDGYRFDLVKGLGNNNSYGSGTDSYNASRVARMKRLHGVITSVKPNGIHINENLAGDKEEIEMGNDGQIQWANINGNSCQFTMGYAETSSMGANLNCFLSTNQGGRPWGSTIAYAESHDEERMGYKNNTYGAPAVKRDRATSLKRLGALAAQLVMTPGPKMIWQFGELGADQTTKTGSENNTDPKIVLWNRLNDADYSALHETYQLLIRMRTANPELFRQSATFSATGLGGSLSVNRVMRLTAGQKEVMVFINASVSGANRSIEGTSTLLNANNSQLICASPGTTARLNGTGTSVSVTLAPNTFAVFATKAVTGIDDVELGSVAENKNEVYATDGEIIITGEYQNVAVYDMAGRLQGSLKVNPGIYVVNVDGAVSKVVVK